MRSKGEVVGVCCVNERTDGKSKGTARARANAKAKAKASPAGWPYNGKSQNNPKLCGASRYL
jgi:hypothetical protein